MTEITPGVQHPTRFLDRPGGRIAYDVAGEGPLVVCVPGMGDPAAEAAFVADRLGGRVVMVPGAGHYPHAEYPEIVNPAILDFLRGEAGHA